MKRPDFHEILHLFPRMHSDDIRDEIPYLFPIYSYLFPTERYRSRSIRCSDQDKAFRVSIVSKAMEEYRSRPPQVNLDISESLGRLSALPRELRDEVYEYVLPRGHTLFWREKYSENVNHFKSNSDTEDIPGSNPALLRLSKHIHEEAMTLLYSQNTFVFSPSWNFSPRSPRWEPIYPPCAAIVALRRLPKPIHEKVTNFLYSQNPFGLFPAWSTYNSWKPDNLPSAAILDHITNVELHLGLKTQFVKWNRHTEEFLQMPFKCILPGPVTLFAGTETRRQSALIKIQLHDWYTRQITPSPLFAAIGQLTGFWKVTVRLYGSTLSFCPVESVSNEDWATVLWAGMEPMLEAFRVKLERTLGRGVLGAPKSNWDVSAGEAWMDLVFWPGVEGAGDGEGGSEE